MSGQQPQLKRTVLTDDGELRDVSDAPETQGTIIYCDNCGAASRSTARFCRSCGESLDEQIPASDGTHTYGAPGQKIKRTLEPVYLPAPSRPSFWSVALEVLTVLFVTAMVATTSRYGSSFTPFAILVAWVLVEMARHGVFGGGRR